MSSYDDMTPEEVLREQGLHLVTRLVALLRTGRSYRIDNQVFTGQLEQLLELLRPTLMAHGRAQLVQMDGDLYLNGERIPLRASSLRFQSQLHSEFALREISGVEFHASLGLGELEEFMRYFLPSELYKGAELAAACAAAGITSASPVLHVVASDAEHAVGNEGDAAPAFAHAFEAYDTALRLTRALFAPGRFERGVELRHAKRLVQPLIDAAATQEPAIVGLAWASAEDDQAAHGLHVCLVSIGIGQRLGLDRRALADLGVAALLHDVGQSTLSDVPADAGERNEAERERLESHTTQGVSAIARNTTLNRTSLRAMRVALEHHACAAGGHPVLTRDGKPSAASRVVALADAFVSLISLHGDRGGSVTPYAALGSVLGTMGADLEPALGSALVRAVGVYPPGQVVELDDRSLARALAPSQADPERPIVEMLTTPEGTLLSSSERVVMPLAEGRVVTRALPTHEWPDLSSDSAAA